MRIKDLKIHILREQKIPYRPYKITWSLVRVFTDEGIEGDYLLEGWTTGEELARRFTFDKEKISNIDILEKGKIEKLWSAFPYDYDPLNNRILCAINVCLWDITGKYFKVPIYKLLGAYREKILAYASTPIYEKEDDYVNAVLECKEKGYKAFKIHPTQNWRRDIKICKAVREAAGDEMILMLDPVSAYTREEALKVGKEIDKLGFYWYEDPIPTTDIDGLAELCKLLDVKILIGERIPSIYGYTEYIRRHAIDALRCVIEEHGGINSAIKIAHLAETFGMKCEPHSWGHTLTQASHLHVMLAISNCDFFELPIPEGIYDFGMKDVIRIDKDGHVHAPEKPGLGYEIDWDEIEKLTIKVLP